MMIVLQLLELQPMLMSAIFLLLTIQDFSDEGNYTSSLLTGPISGFTAFIWDGASGVYSINATSGTVGDGSVALNLDDGSGDECTVTASEELFTDILDSALPTEITCFNLVSGETYFIGFATDAGSEGILDLEFIDPLVLPPANSECPLAEDQGTIVTNCTR